MKETFVLHKEHFADSTLDEMITAGLKVEPVPAKVGTVGGTGQKLDENTRRSKIRWIQKENEDYSTVFPIFEKMFHEANKKSFGFDINFLQSIQFTEYPAETLGHYDWHVDVFWETQEYYQRKLSMVVQLSDPNDYEGGELQLDEWKTPDPESLKKRGSVIIFPSFIKHRVTPVTKGLRRSLVAWIDGPLWR